MLCLLKVTWTVILQETMLGSFNYLSSKYSCEVILIPADTLDFDFPKLIVSCLVLGFCSFLKTSSTLLLLDITWAWNKLVVVSLIEAIKKVEEFRNVLLPFRYHPEPQIEF